MLPQPQRSRTRKRKMEGGYAKGFITLSDIEESHNEKPVVANVGNSKKLRVKKLEPKEKGPMSENPSIKNPTKNLFTGLSTKTIWKTCIFAADNLALGV